MRIRRIRLKEICRHEVLDWQMGPGVIGILGPNGAGKSTAVNAVYAALTNDYGRFETGKKGLIRQQAPEDAKASIQVEVDHLGHRYSITRGIRPDKHEFKLVGDTGDSRGDPLTKAGEIGIAIEERLGITRALLDNYVFVAQWDMFAFLSLTEAERAKHFARLCGTTGAELRWGQLGKQLELDRELAVEVVDTSDDIRQELGTSNKRKNKLAAKQIAAEERRLDSDEVKRLQAAGPKRQRFVQAQRDLPQAQQHEEELLTVAKKTNTAVKEGETALQVSQKSLRQAQDAVDAQAKELAELKASLKGHEKRQCLKKELKTLKKKAQKPPKWPAELAELLEELETKEAVAEDVEQHAQETSDVFRDAEELIENCGGTELVECPTCKTPTTAGSLHERLCEAGWQLPQLETDMEAAQARLTVLEDYKKAVHDYEVRESSYNANVRNLESRIAETIQIDPEQVQERIGELDDVVNMRDDCRDNVELAEHVLPKLRKKKQDAIASHVAAKQKKAQVEDTLATCQVSNSQASEAANQLVKHQAAIEEVAGLKSQISEIERNQRAAKNRLKEMNAALAQSKKGREWAVFLGAARAVLHRDRLPAEVHKAVLGEMQNGINADLNEFGAPFSVRSNESLGFTAFFHDGVVMPAGGLSGGEKVTLALPFRLQVNSMFAAQVGMLVLDEPTAGLDADHIEAVIEVFNQLRGMAKARGFQIIVITHERELERAFDQVFNVGSS